MIVVLSRELFLQLGDVIVVLRLKKVPGNRFAKIILGSELTDRKVNTAFARSLI